MGEVKKVLVVDDDEDVIASICDFLVGVDGHACVGFDDAARALEFMRVIDDDALPNLILTDYEMPGMNGLEFCRQLRANERYKHIRVVVCSGSAPADIGRTFDGVPVEILIKPLDMKSIRAMLKS